MANNRLYIKCNNCGGMLFIGKHFLEGWYVGDYNENYNKKFGEVINDFHDKHIECFYERYDNPYTIITESEIDELEYESKARNIS